MKKLHQSRVVGCELAEKLRCLRPRRGVDLAPRLSCDSDLDPGPHLSPIVEEMGLAAGELLDLGDDASLQVESGPTETDSPSQVGSSAPSLLPLEIPVVMVCSEADAGLDEMGVGSVCSVQRNSVLPGTDCIVSVADLSRLTADVAGGELMVPSISVEGKAVAGQLGDNLTAGVRLKDLGQPSIMAVAHSSKGATSVAHSAEKGSGVGGGSGHSRPHVRPVEYPSGHQACAASESITLAVTLPHAASHSWLRVVARVASGCRARAAARVASGCHAWAVERVATCHRAKPNGHHPLVVLAGYSHAAGNKCMVLSEASYGQCGISERAPGLCGQREHHSGSDSSSRGQPFLVTGCGSRGKLLPCADSGSCGQWLPCVASGTRGHSPSCEAQRPSPSRRPSRLLPRCGQQVCGVVGGIIRAAV
ncbi:hypothetical protein Dimus_029148 [Dionaea muscipula]